MRHVDQNTTDATSMQTRAANRTITEAIKTKEKLAILLLDFEKAYDRVEWSFLQDTLLNFGFEEPWIKGIAALYSIASNKVLQAREKGTLFSIT